MNENPIVEQFRFHLGLVVESAVRHKHIESLFQSAASLGRIGEASGKKHLDLEAQPICQILSQIASMGSLMNRSEVWGKAVSANRQVLASYAINSIGTQLISVSTIYGYLSSYYPMLYRAIEMGATVNKIPEYEELAKVFETSNRCIAKIINTFNEVDLEKSEHVYKALKYIEYYTTFLRNLSENINSSDTHFTEMMASSISDISNFLNSKTKEAVFAKHEIELRQAVRSLMFQLVRFAQNAKEIRNKRGFDALVESAAKIGIHAVEIDDAKTAIEAIDVIELLAKVYLEKRELSYYEVDGPSIMKRASFIGTLGLKNDMDSVINHFKLKALEFHTRAIEQVEEYVLASHEKITVHFLEDKVRRFREECVSKKYNRLPFDRSSEAEILRKIECEDIEKLCEYVWGSDSNGS